MLNYGKTLRTVRVKRADRTMEENDFRRGFLDGVPICVGYFAVALAFGIFAVQSGLTAAEALLISLTNLTSAGQLAGVPILTGGGTLVELALTQLVINARYALMSISLAQKLSPSVKLWQRFLIAFGNTDEVFAVATTREGAVGPRYMAGLILSPMLGWNGGTLLGGVAGSLLPPIVIASLGMAIYGMFVAIVMPEMKKSAAVTGCVLLSVAASCLFRYVPFLAANVPGGFVIILCAVAASAVMALVAPIPQEEEAQHE